jgi:hypothetical protein
MDALDAFKAEASFLLKNLNGEDKARALRAAMRLRVIAPFQGLAAAEVLERAAEVRRKHALSVVALERGYASWAELKQACEAGRVEAPILDLERLITGIGGIHLSRWFSRYEDAAAELTSGGGYLLPYKTQFVVMDVDTIQTLGFDPRDPDWGRVGRDLARPAEPDARRRLLDRWKAVNLRS